MRVLIEAHHPAHIHFFKHAVRTWRARGDDVLLIGRDRDVMRRLLAAYDFIPYEVSTRASTNNRFPLVEMLERQAKVGAAIARFRPDVVLSVMGSCAQSAFVLRVPNVIFTDSEHQTFSHRIAHPFATRIYTPECFWKDLGSKQRRYAGYHELAFLHPSRFAPDPSVLRRLGSPAPGSYAVLRVSAWNTLHDVGNRGFGTELDTFMEQLTARLPVFVAAEDNKISARWASHRLVIEPHEFHDVLAHARLVVTEGASTASEAACLGVPVVYVNTIRLGYLDEQESRYGLVRNRPGGAGALEQCLELLDSSPAVFQAARDRLVADHVDVTGTIVAEIDGLVPRY
jgi:predicted glycosyltransferase